MPILAPPKEITFWGFLIFKCYFLTSRPPRRQQTRNLVKESATYMLYKLNYRQSFPHFVILSQISLPWQQRSAGGKYK